MKTHSSTPPSRSPRFRIRFCTAAFFAITAPLYAQEPEALPTSPPGEEASITNSQIAQSSLILARGSEWRYLDTGDAPGEGWKAPEFDDASWKSGPAPLGYGEDDIGTEISFGDDPEDKMPAAFFRTTFELPALEDPEQDNTGTLAGRIRFDDGIILFLNETEIFRMNMPPSGEPGPDVFSSGKVSSSSRWEGRYEKFFFDPALLVEGVNVVAAQVHQSDAGSSDLILDFELERITAEEAKRAAVPDLFTDFSGNVAEPSPGKELFLDDLEVVRNIVVKGKRLLSEGRAVPGRSLVREMENNRQHPVPDLAVGGFDEFTPAELYERCAPSVLIISPVSESSDPGRPGEGWGSGFVVSARGVAVTNWHVIEAMKGADMITATTFDGRVFPVKSVLAARKTEDVAVLQIDTGGDLLKPLPLANSGHVGQQVTIISHPSTNFYNLTNGYVSRFFKSRANGARLISVSADIAGGSSGAPILNVHGEVIGVVSMTESLGANPAQRRRTSSPSPFPQDDGDATEDADDESSGDAEAQETEDETEEDSKGSDSGEEETQEEQGEEQQQPQRQQIRVIPSVHQMTMKYGAPAVSVMELLE